MGTELEKGILSRLGAASTRRTAISRGVSAVVALLVALVAAGAAQALTLRVPGTPATVGGSPVNPAASLAHLPSGGAAVQPDVDAAARAVRTILSGSASAAPAAGGSMSANPAPTAATHPRSVATPSSVQQVVSSALSRAGVTSGRSGSAPELGAATRPSSVTGSGGSGIGGKISSEVTTAIAGKAGHDRTRLVRGGSNPGRGAAPLGQRAAHRRGVRSRAGRAGAGHRSAGTSVAAHLKHFGRSGERRAARVYQRPLLPLTYGAATAAESSAGDTAPGAGAPGARAHRVSASGASASRHRRSAPKAASAPAPVPATQAPLLPPPVPTGPAAAAGGGGGGVGGTAVVLFMIAAIWLFQFMAGRISLEASAWQETVLPLRLERPG